MNHKQLLWLIIVGVALGGMVFFLQRKKSASFERVEKSKTEQLLGDFPVNDVAQIAIRHGTNEVNLIKAGGWTVQERSRYPAHAEAIVKFARQLWDLRPAQSQKIGPSQLGRLELLTPGKGGTNANSGTLVELKNKDGKIIRELVLGKTSLRGGGNDPSGGGWPNGRWIYLPDKPGMTYLVPEPFSEIEPRPEQWLSKDFFHVENARSVEVVFPVATNSWKLTRETETNEWKLADAKATGQLDPSKSASVSSAFTSMTFVDVSPGDTVSAGATNPPTIIRIGTFDGFDYTVKVGSKTNEDLRLTISVAAQFAKDRIPGKDEKAEGKAKLDQEFKDRQQKLADKLKREQSYERWTYLVSGWAVETLLKERSQLLIDRKEEPKAEGNSSTNTFQLMEPPKAEQPPLPVSQPQ